MEKESIKKRIHILEPRLANQIAAGEVVERPASVVKELLENSLDAGATLIEIDIDKGGKQLIQIRDNGCGIHQDDLNLAVARHATSKLKTLDDLERIQSLGFRGEALASIASVSRFTLQTCYHESKQAYLVKVEGKELNSNIQPCAHPQGTTVIIRDLFFNTPARRKFLRTEKTEFNYIEEVIKRIALTNDHVSIQLKHNHKLIFKLPALTNASSKEQRIAKIFGQSFIDNSVPFDFSWQELRLWGRVGLPEYSRSQTDLQYCYVNGRIIRDKLINHAIRQAYSDVMYPGRHPVYLFYLELDPSRVDVNVHPTKHEVRFNESRLVHDFIVRCIEQALSTEEADTSSDQDTTAQVVLDIPVVRYQMKQTSNQYQVQKKPTTQTTSKIIGQFKEKYVLIEDANDLILLDIQKAKQAILYERLRQTKNSGQLIQQPLLIPQTVALETKDKEYIKSGCTRLNEWGFDLSPISSDSVIVRQIPALLAEAELDVLLRKSFEKMRENDTIFSVSNVDNACQFLAEIGNKKVIYTLSMQAIQTLLNEITDWVPNKKRCFFQWIISHQEINTYFSKRNFDVLKSE